jgi:UDP-N-acetylglucosamine 2-epimerase (non-hydrolysing)/UDP-GlcNAc3NAcA epimerase
VRILAVVGNRPQFVKAAAVSRPLRERHEEVLVHTGQHHDENLSEIFFAELSVPEPDYRLEIWGASNASQLARMLAALEPVLRDVDPDALLAYGDTNSTLAAALAGADAGVPVVHVEAGMRCFDPGMPEERNRVLTDHVSSLLLCSSELAAANLAREAIGERAVVVGDVMVDLAIGAQALARAQPGPLRSRGLEPGSYLLLTAHRAGNVDDPARLQSLLRLIEALPAPVLFPIHPRTRQRLLAAGLWERLRATPGVQVSEPLGYREFTALMCQARAVLTDSGGLQKEAYLARVPCLTLRASTEWVETVESGWNTLVDLDAGAALRALERTPPGEHPELYGDGHAAERCVEAIGRLPAR